MRRLFSILLLLSIGSVCSGQISKKEQLCIEVVKTAKSYDDLAPAIRIIKSHTNVYRFIPSLHPIAKKNKPKVSSCYGNRYHPIDKTWKVHSGIDFVAEYATSIHSTADGTVVFVGIKSGYGKCVVIEHNYGFKTMYAHLTEYYTKQGNKVKKGAIIGFLGNTGKSTGAHLHYEIIKNDKKINPTNFIDIDN